MNRTKCEDTYYCLLDGKVYISKYDFVDSKITGTTMFLGYAEKFPEDLAKKLSKKHDLNIVKVFETREIIGF